MCGRYTLITAGEQLAALLRLDEAPALQPRFNIAPTQPVLAVRQGAGGREAIVPRWGLVPSWAADPSVGHRMINARAETVAEKPAYRGAFRQRRCLVAADGFYEWQTRAEGKQPFCFRLWGGAPFAFAGLWETWPKPEGGLLTSCTILTTEANDLVRPVHERMPVILAARYHDEWLDPDLREPERLRSLLRPYLSEDMTAYPVSAWVGNPRHEDPRCLAPLV